jgi:hypothetical protein
MVEMIQGTQVGQNRALDRRQRMEIGATLFFPITEMIELPDNLLAVQ